MRKILKALSLVMVLVMCFTMVFTTAVSAEGTDTLVLSVDNAAPKAGDTVNITVTSNFTTVAGAHFAIDLAGLEYVSVAGDYAEYFSAETMNFVKEFNEDNGNLVESGVLFVITATVPADAEAGTVYNVGFGTIATNKEFCDYNENEVVVTKTGVDVTVAADAPACDHANAAKVLKEKTETAFVYDFTCDCGVTGEKTIEIGTPYSGSPRAAASIEPANDISMFFKFAKDQIANWSDYVLVVNKENYEQYATEANTLYYNITSYDANSTLTDGTPAVSFTFGEINAWDMSSAVGFDLYGYDAEANKMIRLRTYSGYSVVKYATSQYGKTSDARFKTALIDLLNYGSAVQEFKNININNLANSTLTDAQKASATQTYPDANTPFQTVDTNVQYPNTNYKQMKVGVSIVPGATLGMQVTLNTISDFTGDVDNLYVKFDYSDRFGNAADPYVVNVTEESYIVEATGRTAVLFGKAPMSTLNYPVNVSVCYGDPAGDNCEVLTTFSYAIENYVQKNITSTDAALVKVLQTIYAYGYSLATFSNVPALG